MADQAYVWVWLPGQAGPVVAGRVFRDGPRLSFNYGRSYLERPDAIALYLPELPLEAGAIAPLPGLSIPSALRDAAPDAWGRRVILNRLLGRQARDGDVDRIDEITYLLESGSDRTGALDFQASATDYVARAADGATLDELIQSAERVEAGVPLTPELDRALHHGSSLGGARPKALITDGARKYVAKFPASGDVQNVVKAEFVAMRLAAEVGLDVAPVTLVRAHGKDVLLVERFDREAIPGGWARRAMISALTMLELDEMMARYASYETLAEIIRHRFAEPKAMLRELFGRLVFNILCGNTDDHARNHAAFWDGRSLTLTPAYDICPQARAGGEASQAMLIRGESRDSRIAVCIAAAPIFLLDAQSANAIVDHQIQVITARYDAVCAEGSQSVVDRDLMRGRQFLNAYALEGYAGSVPAWGAIQT
ncbi:type II toxin-antitoxin system HipA family toxin [Sphingomonas sp. CGMCC 1.13654]|uniref:Type II toxin-antitoxin system HipA family toxin n=1 Tax=Sphingomonas chungangi TaxID=2683589 RepID=A0A838L140_9SPHN|nr:HipA domain-containing protein [Sphingomonas chungangi]MBA2933061.1 type II toxin-antitoxin system HipA family toxin [Sphingomonas chungangi]MVW56681.1 type II toxin-antitoxin system HipA family toxin [Sphingomonas chungangi]